MLCQYLAKTYKKKFLMSNLKLLNKFFFQFFLIIIFIFPSISEETEDIWKINNEINSTQDNEETLIPNDQNEISIYDSLKPIENNIEEDSKLASKENKIFGLLDPEENNLSIDMWSNSDGKIILDKLKKIGQLKLSKDAENILFIALFTNAHSPKKNISPNVFSDYKSEWLIKEKKINLIEKYLKKNQNIGNQTKLIEFLINEYLSEADVNKACEKTNLLNYNYSSEYLDKFKIYCLVNDNKIEEAQLQFDLLKENGFKNHFYEKKINFLLGYLDQPDKKISDKNLLEFHLSHRVNSEFNYEPNENTSKYIWSYLSASNLIYNAETIDIEDEVKINLLERAVADEIYDSKELFKIYKKILFNINQFLNISESYKSLPNFKARALLYQSILLSDNLNKKMKLILKLHELFENDNIGLAFSNELKSILSTIEREDVPEKYLSAYDYYLKKEDKELKKIKFNNNVIHRSKLLKYFIDEKYNEKNLEKDLEHIYKKIKKNKKYYFSTQDIVLLESLESDGFEVPKKIKKLYSSDNLTVPANLENLSDQNEIGLILLNIVEIVGEDKFNDLDSDSIYFIISILNKLGLKKIRNNIILKSFPERA